MNTALAITRLATFGSVSVLIGALCFVPLVWPEGFRSRRLHNLMRAALVATGVSSLAAGLAYGPYVTGRSFRGLFDPAVHANAIETSFGLSTVLRIALLAVLAAIVWNPRRQGYQPKSAMTLLGLLTAIAFTMSLTVHASAKGPIALAADMAHVMAAGIWIGGIVALVGIVLPHRPTHELAQIIPAFSKVAFSCIVVLALTGTLQVIIQLGTINVIGLSTYGNLIAAKVAAFVIILGLGYLSRGWVRRRYMYDFEGFPEEDWSEAEQDAFFRQGLRRSVMAEVVIAIAILAITAALVTGNPTA